MSIASEINHSGLSVESSADKAASAKQTCEGFVRYIFKDDSMISVSDDGVTKAYESSEFCGGPTDEHLYDDGQCEFCGVHEDEA